MQHSKPQTHDKPQKKYYSSKKKFCHYCKERITLVDFKNGKILSHFISETGKILPGRVTGTCAYHQKQLSKAIKRARHMALIRYIENRK